MAFRDLLHGVDCDDDTVLLKVEQVGKAACHKGYPSCFFRKVNGDVEVIEEKVFDPEKVYKGKPNPTKI